MSLAVVIPKLYDVKIVNRILRDSKLQKDSSANPASNARLELVNDASAQSRHNGFIVASPGAHIGPLPRVLVRPVRVRACDVVPRLGILHNDQRAGIRDGPMFVFLMSSFVAFACVMMEFGQVQHV